LGKVRVTRFFTIGRGKDERDRASILSRNRSEDIFKIAKNRGRYCLESQEGRARQHLPI
jgi:hypothetical protein